MISYCIKCDSMLADNDDSYECCKCGKASLCDKCVEIDDNQDEYCEDCFDDLTASDLLIRVPAFKYPIGYKFKTRGRLCEVIDYRIICDARGKVTALRYVTSHKFMNQTIKDYDVVQATLDMSEKVES